MYGTVSVVVVMVAPNPALPIVRFRWLKSPIAREVEVGKAAMCRFVAGKYQQRQDGSAL